MAEGPNFERPQYFESLTNEDQMDYQIMQRQVGGEEMRYNRNKRLVTFTDQMSIVKKFCIRNDTYDSLRCSVCGIYWLADETLAINIRQFKLLLAKSKSSINGALAKMGYKTVQSNANDFRVLASLVPPMKNQSMEMRQWTIRRRSTGVVSPQPAPLQPILAIDRVESISPINIDDFDINPLNGPSQASCESDMGSIDYTQLTLFDEKIGFDNKTNYSTYCPGLDDADDYDPFCVFQSNL